MISGTVKRCSNGDNFQGVTVTAFKNGVKLASTTTKADGTYTLGFKSAGKVFTVTASYPGHKSSIKTVNVNNNSIGRANFQLGMDNVYVSPAGSDTTGTGTADAPYKTIQKGLNNVNPGGTIYLANGNYENSVTINKNVHIVGESQENTIITATFDIRYAVNVTVTNLTMKQDYYYDNSIFNFRGSCYIINCTFTGTGRNKYSAIYNLETCYIAGCTFIGNNASGYREDMGGGAICNYGTITGLSGCTFINNTAFNGGAIWNWHTIDYIIGCTFTGNSAVGDHGTGGAICNIGTIDYMNGCIFIGNFAKVIRSGYTSGGAIANVNYGKIESKSRINIVSSCTFTGNSATYGGAVFNMGSYISLRDCSITGNNANNGTDICSVGGTVVAEYNWWGSSSGPSSSQVYGVQISKWLKVPILLGLGSMDPGNNSSNGNQNTVNAASKVSSAAETIGLQKTGMPLNYLLLAILMVLGSLVPKRK
ncbi:carboxypeptidase regulatory-like domain-containing protein [Methanobacterium sp.]|uniref:carboxypeptidase regulatory-like domain-containing protein n=1 Tax=Methanobacterium sp. TaxID=2164 RepID=UPI003C78DDF0